MTPDEAATILRDHALGTHEHDYLGLCPHPDDTDTRDPDCRVCQAIDTTEVKR